MTSIFAGAFAFGVGFDIGVTAFWDRWNRGVSVVHHYPWSFSQLTLYDIYSETVEGSPPKICARRVEQRNRSVVDLTALPCLLPLHSSRFYARLAQ